MKLYFILQNSHSDVYILTTKDIDKVSLAVNKLERAYGGDWSAEMIQPYNEEVVTKYIKFKEANNA